MGKAYLRTPNPTAQGSAREAKRALERAEDGVFTYFIILGQTLDSQMLQL